MTRTDFQQLILHIVEKCVALKNKYVSEHDLDIDYICIFAHSKEEYEELYEQALTFGPIVKQTETGPIYKMRTPISSLEKQPMVLKIRMPDPTKTQLGDVDFNTNYQNFKEKYVGKDGFTLIQRETFEMIELNDGVSDVLVYFSSIPPSKLI